MKLFLIVTLTLLATPSVFADVFCKTEARWSLQFNSGDYQYFTGAQHLLPNNELSDVDVEIVQVYESPSEFKARVILDTMDAHIKTDLSSRVGGEEYTIYAGIIEYNGTNQPIYCAQE